MDFWGIMNNAAAVSPLITSKAQFADYGSVICGYANLKAGFYQICPLLSNHNGGRVCITGNNSRHD
jgi:hypothetical protein